MEAQTQRFLFNRRLSIKTVKSNDLPSNLFTRMGLAKQNIYTNVATYFTHVNTYPNVFSQISKAVNCSLNLFSLCGQ